MLSTMKLLPLRRWIRPTQRYDLGLAWNWEHDAAFVARLAQQMAQEGLQLLTVTDQNLSVILEHLSRKEIAFRSFWDRAADADQRYNALHAFVKDGPCRWFNPADRARWAWNKATMHLELISAGIVTPYTILLDPYNLRPELPALDLTVLGRDFVIKPAHGGGGEGVIHAANGLDSVQAARRMHPQDYYLLQARVDSVWLGEQPAWFRAIMAFDNCFVTWWNPWTHRYRQLAPGDESLVDLEQLHSMMQVIKRVCNLDIFSSEIALTAERKYVVVDYINDPIDLRLQSLTPDGVPDEIVDAVISALLQLLKKRK
jgi:hypothetical protein